MNYHKLYVNLLNKHGTEDKPAAYYTERHHIQPKSLGGSDDIDNLVYLNARVHFLAHWILFKIFKCEKTARAFYGMCDSNRRPERGCATGRKYEIAKRAFSEYNHMRLDEHRERAAISAKSQWDERYEEMKASNAFMFKDEMHPMYMKGKTGDAHPRSRAVITPLGRFGSVRDAGRAHGVAHYVISRKCKLKHTGFFYEDQM